MRRNAPLSYRRDRRALLALACGLFGVAATHQLSHAQARDFELSRVDVESESLKDYKFAPLTAPGRRCGAAEAARGLTRVRDMAG